MKLNRRDFITTSALLTAAAPLRGLTKFSGTSEGNRSADFKLCVFSKHLQFLDYEATADTVAEIGFDGVDLAVRPRGHVLPERVEQDLPRAVAAVNKAGLKVYMMTTAITDAQEAYTQSILKLADEHDIRFYRMGYLRYDDKKGVAGTLDDLRPQMHALADVNSKYGIHGAYQNHAGTRIGGPVWDVWEIIKDLDPSWLGCQYDVRHAVVEGGTSWPLGLRLLHRHIKTLVLKDFYWTKITGEWKIQNCPLGEGMVDWPRFLAIIKELGIRGPVSMHFEYPVFDESDSLQEKRRKSIAAMRTDLLKARALLNAAGLV